MPPLRMRLGKRFQALGVNQEETSGYNSDTLLSQQQQRSLIVKGRSKKGGEKKVRRLIGKN